jgi:hypothetical protein
MKYKGFHQDSCLVVLSFVDNIIMYECSTGKVVKPHLKFIQPVDEASVETCQICRKTCGQARGGVEDPRPTDFCVDDRQFLLILWHKSGERGLVQPNLTGFNPVFVDQKPANPGPAG